MATKAEVWQNWNKLNLEQCKRVLNTHNLLAEGKMKKMDYIQLLVDSRIKLVSKKEAEQLPHSKAEVMQSITAGCLFENKKLFCFCETSGKWYPAVVKKMRTSKQEVKIHFEGYATEDDITVHKDSEMLSIIRPADLNSNGTKLKKRKAKDKKDGRSKKRTRTRSISVTVDVAEEPQALQDWVDRQFENIVGQDRIKQQLVDFIAETRVKMAKQSLGLHTAGVEPLYHMVFRGPPGTGKTTIAMLVAKILYKLGVTENEKVEIVLNPLVWKGTHCGETVPKVNKSVNNAEGGVLFIDEAYFLLQANDKFGEEILGTIMSHMLPPKCVFMFAGYAEKMEKFMTANAGLKSRCPYIFNFEAYDADELVKIFRVLCRSHKEVCVTSDEELLEVILRANHDIRMEYNGRLSQRLLDFAKERRNLRLCSAHKTSAALEKLGRKLCEIQLQDVQDAMDKFIRTTAPAQKNSGSDIRLRDIMCPSAGGSDESESSDDDYYNINAS